MSRLEKIVNGVGWTTVYNIINAIYGFISVPLLINHYGQNDYGLIGLALSINVYMQLMDLGFNSTNIRFFSIWLNEHNNLKIRQGFQSSLAFYGVIGIINALVLLSILVFSSEIFKVNSVQDHILKCLLGILMISAIINWYSSCFDQLIKATENVGWIQKRSIIPKLIQGILLVIVIFWNLPIELYFALSTFAFIIIIPISIKKILSLIPNISFIPKLYIQILKEILPYSLGIFSFSIFQFSFYNLRPVFLGMQGSLSDVTDYRVLNGIISLVNLFAGMFLSVLLPTTSKIVAENNQKAFESIAYKGTKYITIIIVMLCFGLMTIGPEVLYVYVGKSYPHKTYLTLVPWLNLWLICTLGNHNQAISSLILAGSKVKAIAINSAVASISGLMVSWFLIPKAGIGGVIYGLVVYTIIQIGFYYLYYWPIKMKINSRKVFIKSFIPYVGIGLIGYVIANKVLITENSWINILIKLGVFTIIYLIGISFTLDIEDKIQLKRLFK